MFERLLTVQQCCGQLIKNYYSTSCMYTIFFRYVNRWDSNRTHNIEIKYSNRTVSLCSGNWYRGCAVLLFHQEWWSIYSQWSAGSGFSRDMHTTHNSRGLGRHWLLYPISLQTWPLIIGLIINMVLCYKHQDNTNNHHSYLFRQHCNTLFCWAVIKFCHNFSK